MAIEKKFASFFAEERYYQHLEELVEYLG